MARQVKSDPDMPASLGTPPPRHSSARSDFAVQPPDSPVQVVDMTESKTPTSPEIVERLEHQAPGLVELFQQYSDGKNAEIEGWYRQYKRLRAERSV